MSDKHFTLDIDPDGLRSVATKLSTLKNHIETKAGTVKGTPGDIGDSWTGEAATSIKNEMTGLGNLMDRYGDKLQPAIEKLRSLARDYDDALDRLPELNRKWEQAETDYQNALDANQDKVDRTRAHWREQGMTINTTRCAPAAPRRPSTPSGRPSTTSRSTSATCGCTSPSRPAG